MSPLVLLRAWPFVLVLLRERSRLLHPVPELLHQKSKPVSFTITAQKEYQITACREKAKHRPAFVLTGARQGQSSTTPHAWIRYFTLLFPPRVQHSCAFVHPTVGGQRSNGRFHLGTETQPSFSPSCRRNNRVR